MMATIRVKDNETLRLAFKWALPGDEIVLAPGLYERTDMPENKFKIGDRIRRKEGDPAIGTIVEAPEWTRTNGTIPSHAFWIEWDGDSYWPLWSTSPNKFEHYVEENDMPNLTDTVLDLMAQGNSPDEIREALAEAEAKHKIYMEGYEAGKAMAEFQVSEFTASIGGSYRRFRVVGVNQAGANSDHDALLKVEEIVKDGHQHPKPLPKTYGIKLTNGSWQGSRFYTV